MYGCHVTDPQGNDITFKFHFYHFWTRRHDSPQTRNFVRLLIKVERIRRERITNELF